MSDKGNGSDAKYFSTTKKGEVHELKSDLNSLNKDKKKEAVKKVIAAMTVGKDVSALFTDVIKGMDTDNIELKKLVYLYIINYARSQPDKAILIVNTIKKDAEDRSPLVRALAIRTMGCIRVDGITEYLCEPLRKALVDKDPYVRKTAAVCVAKIYDIDKELVEEQQFLETLRKMIRDGNSMVVANAVASLAEIAESSHTDVFQINKEMLSALVAALNECTEWGQVFILDALSKYEPSAKDAEEIIERVSPRLKHANSAVAMSAVKVIMKYLEYIKNPKLEKRLIQQKLPPPLITLLSEQRPEIQYVALRNINLIVQKRPAVLANGVKHFFCKYNDPIYVKMEKLEIMIKLANSKNVEKVLMEFKEYATEVDVEFVRKSVRAIGRCAIKLDTKVAERCIKVLHELIQSKINYVVQEAIIVIKDIFRKYPNRYESIIATLCENLDTLDEPEAKGSMVWIIGEYADRIDNSPELLDNFVGTFEEESTQVQLQLLTAVVKLFLKRPEDAKAMVNSVLKLATENSDNPDLRDRGYIYWRLLSTDPEAAQTVVLSTKPVISDQTYQLEESMLDVLVSNISTLASIYHKPPEFFVRGGKSTVVLKPSTGNKSDSDDYESGSDESESGSDSGSGSGSGSDSESNSSSSESSEEEVPMKKEKKKRVQAKPVAKPVDALDAMMAPDFMDAPAQNQAPILLDASKGNQMTIRGAFSRKNNQLHLDLNLTNKSGRELRNFAMRFNKNFAGVTLANSGPLKVGSIASGASTNHSIPLVATDQGTSFAENSNVQVALKTDAGVLYFQARLDRPDLFDAEGKLERKEFLTEWKQIPESSEKAREITTSASTVDDLKAKFAAKNVFYIADRTVQGKGKVAYFSMKYILSSVLVEITLGGSCKVITKSRNDAHAAHSLEGICSLL